MAGGHSFFPAPRCRRHLPPRIGSRGPPGPYGKGPLVEQRHGLARAAAPSLGPWFRPRPPGVGLRAERQKVCGGTLAPCTAATALRPWPPLGGRWLRPAAAPGLRPARYAVASPPGTQAPGYAGLGLTPPSRRPSLRRRPGPPPPTRGATPRLRSRRGTRSWGSPLGCSVWA